jgi:predicted RNA-binding Zn-ribbon protein involved in translation (DUF1610 family)
MVLFAWVMRGATPPRAFTTSFMYQHRQHFAIVETIPESPLYCPRVGFFTIVRDKRCTQQIYDLLCDMRDLTCGFLDPDLIGPREPCETVDSTPESIYSRVLDLPSARLFNIAVTGNWVYESCRLAAYIYGYQLCAPAANDFVNISPLISVVHNLQSALAKSDISDCWGDMAGVLLWCALVGGKCMYDNLLRCKACTLPHQTQFEKSDLEKHEYCRKWLTLLAVRIGVVLGFQYPEAICTTLRRFTHVQKITVGLI